MGEGKSCVERMVKIAGVDSGSRDDSEQNYVENRKSNEVLWENDFEESHMQMALR